jgi:phosphohistidine phosphatase
MRHSHAVGEHGCRDFDRQLTNAGLQLADKTGQLLNDLAITPDLIVTSAAVRTVQTGQRIAAHFATEIPSVARDDLYQGNPSAYLPAIQSEASPDTSVILAIGHNPGIGSLISRLAETGVSVPPATVGIYSVDTDDWLELPALSNQSATLTHLIVDGQLTTHP